MSNESEDEMGFDLFGGRGEENLMVRRYYVTVLNFYSIYTQPATSTYVRMYVCTYNIAMHKFTSSIVT